MNDEVESNAQMPEVSAQQARPSPAREPVAGRIDQAESPDPMIVAIPIIQQDQPSCELELLQNAPGTMDPGAPPIEATPQRPAAMATSHASPQVAEDNGIQNGHPTHVAMSAYGNGAATEPLREVSKEAARSPLTFGVPGLLQPIPRKPGATSLALVPDTALDWLETEAVSIRAASCRGHMKRYKGDLRQDAFALGEYEGFLWVAVGDGVGSAQHSHVGAALATATAVSGTHAELARQALALRASGAPARVPLESLAAALRSEAARDGRQARDLSTTLLVAAIPLAEAKAVGEGKTGGLDVILWQVGDSLFARIHGDQLTVLGVSDESDSPLANSAVSALPLEPMAQAWVEHFKPGETLALMTDGVSNIASANAEYCSALTSLWDGGAPTPAGLLEVVDATVKSFDDDRTFVGIRFATKDSR